MQKHHVIAVHADGQLEFTRNKELTGMFGGEGLMERVTDIQKLPTSNEYFIRWVLGPWKGRAHTYTMLRNYFNPDECVDDLGIRNPGSMGDQCAVQTPLLFNSYEEAVTHEIAVLDRMRKMGVRFGSV